MLKHPILYRQGLENLDMNMPELVGWLGLAVLHSLLVFWLPYASFSPRDTVWDASSGLMDGIDVRGLVVFCVMTWAMQLSISLNTLSWTRWNIGLIALSQVVFYIFVLVMASSTAFSWDFVGVATQALARPAFYLNVALSCAALTLVDVGVKGARLAFAPRPCDVARKWDSMTNADGSPVWREEHDDSPLSSTGVKNSQAPRRTSWR